MSSERCQTKRLAKVLFHVDVVSSDFARRMVGAIALVAGAAPAWAQKIADGFPGFEVDLVYQAPDIEHPSVVTCDPEGNLFVGLKDGLTPENFADVIAYLESLK